MNFKPTFTKCFSLLLCIMGLFWQCQSPARTEKPTPVDTASIKIKGTQIAELTHPPLVPKPVGNRSAQRLLVSMEIVERTAEMTDGVEYVYWTYGGTVPG